MLSTLYSWLTTLGSPLIDLYMRRRLKRGREDGERIGERYGKPSRARPDGRLVWCHAASNGEAASLLLLIEKLHDVYPDLTILLTTGTVSAARLMSQRLPPYALHQYVPVDRAPYIQNFLNHWNPTLAIWIESELWPNILAALRHHMVPTVLLNARMSDKSFRNWHRAKGWAKEIMSSFSLCLAQTEDDRGRFVALGARPVKCIGNLKYAAQLLSCDIGDLSRLRDQIAGRPVWLMASSHRGEEEMAIQAHKIMLAARPDLLLIIVPRHVPRGNEVGILLNSAGLRVARRSLGEAIAPQTQVYLADTIGELGLFYRLSPIAVIGGSFIPVGGHNPIEAAPLDCAIIFGPYMFNNTGIAKEFINVQAAIQLQHANELAFTVERLLAAPLEREKMAQSARMLADQKRHIIDQVLVELEPWLSVKKQ